MKIKVPLKLWEPPNFVLCGPKGEISIPIEDIDPNDLAMLADEWVSKLYEKAKRPRPSIMRPVPPKEVKPGDHSGGWEGASS